MVNTWSVKAPRVKPSILSPRAKYVDADVTRLFVNTVGSGPTKMMIMIKQHRTTSFTNTKYFKALVDDISIMRCVFYRDR